NDDFTTSLAALLVSNNISSPYCGIALEANLLIIQVLDHSYVSSKADLLAALDIAIREGSDVICMPLGSTEGSEVEQAAYRRAAELGVIVVCPAGNNASNTPVYPAAYPECISVGTVDEQNRLASFSNFGDWVTTTAPGVDIPV